MQHGQGVEVSPRGSKYTGEYCKGVKQGHGRFELSDKSVYVGEMFDNQLSGKGVYEWSDGRKFEGDWVNN